MGRQDSFFDPALAATWRRLLWLMRGSADVVEALVPMAAGMTKDEIARLLARAGAPSGKGVEPVEQVLALLGVVPRSRYEALLRDHEELGARVAEAEQNIERVRRLLREQGLVDEAEQLLDSWGGLVRRTLRAQAGLVRSIAGAGGSAVAPGPTDEAAADPAPEAERVSEPAPAPVRSSRPRARKPPASPSADGQPPRPAPRRASSARGRTKRGG